MRWVFSPIGKIVVEANTMLRFRLEQTRLSEVGAVVRGEMPQVFPLGISQSTGTDG